MSDPLKTLLLLASEVSLADLYIAVQIASDKTISFLVYAKGGWSTYRGETLDFSGTPYGLLSHVTIQYSTSVKLGAIGLSSTPGPYSVGGSSPGVIEYQVGPHTFTGGLVSFTLTVTVGSLSKSQRFTVKTDANSEADPEEIIIIAGPPDTGDTPPPPGRERPGDLVAQIHRFDLVLTTLVERLFKGQSDPLAEKLRFFMQLRNASNAVLAAQVPPRTYKLEADGCGDSPMQGQHRGGPHQAD